MRVCVCVCAQMASVERVEAMGDCLKIGMSICTYTYVCTYESQYNNYILRYTCMYVCTLVDPQIADRASV